jgi:nitrate/nitrite transporter NarK
MKLSDEGMDKEKNMLFAILMGILCAAFVLYISTKSGDAACIFISILVGNFLAHKVDSINHIITAIIFVVLLFILGIPSFSVYALIICTIAAIVDEWGNDISDKNEENKKNLILSNSEKVYIYFFKYRCMLKLAVLLLSILGLIAGLYPNSVLGGIQLFEPLTIIYFCLFDIFYEIANSVFDRIYKPFKSFSR